MLQKYAQWMSNLNDVKDYADKNRDLSKDKIEKYAFKKLMEQNRWEEIKIEGSLQDIIAYYREKLEINKDDFRSIGIRYIDVDEDDNILRDDVMACIYVDDETRRTVVDIYKEE